MAVYHKGHGEREQIQPPGKEPSLDKTTVWPFHTRAASHPLWVPENGHIATVMRAD